MEKNTLYIVEVFHGSYTSKTAWFLKETAFKHASYFLEECPQVKIKKIKFKTQNDMIEYYNEIATYKI